MRIFDLLKRKNKKKELPDSSNKKTEPPPVRQGGFSGETLKNKKVLENYFTEI